MSDAHRIAEPGTEQLCDFILDRWTLDLTRAVSAARDAGLESRVIDAQPLAWAVAWLISEGRSGGGAFAKLLERAPDLESLRAALNAPLRTSNGASSPLQELVCSVACEQRSDWHDPRHPVSDEVRASEASETLGRVWEIVGPRIQANCRGMRSSRPEELAADAWSSIFESYWSVEARRRWGGLSQISTVVTTAARRLHWKSQGKTASPTQEQTEHLAGELEMSIVDRGGLIAAYQQCRDALPVKQRLCVELLLQQQLDRSHIAAAIGCGRPNVTQLLDRGLTSLRECMQGKGFGAV